MRHFGEDDGDGMLVDLRDVVLAPRELIKVVVVMLGESIEQDGRIEGRSMVRTVRSVEFVRFDLVLIPDVLVDVPDFGDSDR